jgi:hypothetical protein
MSNRVTCIGVHSRKGVVCHIVDVMLVEKLLVDDPGSVRYHFVDPPLRWNRTVRKFMLLKLEIRISSKILAWNGEAIRSAPPRS